MYNTVLSNREQLPCARLWDARMAVKKRVRAGAEKRGASKSGCKASKVEAMGTAKKRAAPHDAQRDRRSGAKLKEKSHQDAQRNEAGRGKKRTCVVSKYCGERLEGSSICWV